jgi:myo-inositol-1(or 4)-monophosphatase
MLVVGAFLWQDSGYLPIEMSIVTPVDFATILAQLIPLTKQAGDIPRRYFRNNNFATHTKGSAIDLVTDADRETELFLRQHLTQHFPEIGIVGEEGDDYIPPSGDPDYWWVLDPIDGTTNFAHGLSYFCVMVALATRDYTPVIGVIYNPIQEECYYGYQGGGAFQDGQRLQVSTQTHLVNSLLITGFPYDRFHDPDNNLAEHNALMLQCQGVLRLGSAGLDLAYIAAGRAEGFWEQKLNRWDALAGMLLIREAGGTVTDYWGGQDGLHQPKLQVVASNGHIHPAMLQAIQSARAELAP